MRLLAITARNYRVHREISVELDPARTLIGGPNESGKSTLVEAAHHALFLRAKIGGEAQRGMVSRIHGGAPEVELRFEARGSAWRLLKRFSGSNGTIMLTEADGASRSGDEAEALLADLLGVEAAAGGRGAADRAREQWAHLWAWQGSAGCDPTGHANSQCASLLARLQPEGAAAAMQSECDARAAQAIAERDESIFTKNGTPKSGSDLARALAAEKDAAEKFSAAQQTLDCLDSAISSFHSAAAAIASAGNATQQLEAERQAVEAKRAEAASLRNDEQLQELSAKGELARHAALADADSQIGRLRSQIEQAAGALAPKEAETQRLAADEVESRGQAATADAACQQAVARVRSARLDAELAGAHLRQIEKAAQRDQLRQRAAQVRDLKSKTRALEEQLARVAAITPKQLRAIQEADSERSSASAALEAMAAAIEVLASDAPVRIGDRTVAIGNAHILTDEAEIAIGDAIRLRIRPGGGTSLAAARQRVHDAQLALQSGLDASGAGSVAEAGEALARRQQIEAGIAAEKARLDGLGAATVERDLAGIESECAAAESEIARRAGQSPELAPPATRADAQALELHLSSELGKAEECERNAREARDRAAQRAREAAGSVAAHRAGLEKEKRDLAGLEAHLRVLIETHGDDQARAEKLRALAAAETEAGQLLAATHQRLASLQPDRLDADLARCQRALEAQAAVRSNAAEQRAVALDQLQRDGATDPHAELALAQARLESAREQRILAERRAGATRLLHELFTAAQQALADQFTAPLADKISGYLECLFGPGARAGVTYESSAFQGLRLIRPPGDTGAYEFATLSGGTCEQVAAAVRLAMAEVLAPAHDGCLPLIFDDAFAYSDPARIQTLQRMLDLAATRGLQIVVLTCDPAAYAALGARQVSI